jgi:hypothetical protein
MMVCNFEEQGAPILVFVVVGGGSTMVFSSNHKKKKKRSSDQFAFPFKSYTITRLLIPTRHAIFASVVMPICQFNIDVDQMFP